MGGSQKRDVQRESRTRTRRREEERRRTNNENVVSLSELPPIFKALRRRPSVSQFVGLDCFSTEEREGNRRRSEARDQVSKSRTHRVLLCL